MNGFSVFLCLVATIASVSATDYCSRTLCSPNKQPHIACGHNGEFSANCPADAEIVPITESLKQLLVDGHNEKRNLIAGGDHPKYSKACRMATMQWDDELAALAAFNVKQCKMAHDKCHNTDAFRFAGQNLARTGFFGKVDSAAQIKKSIEKWYNEANDSNQTLIDYYPEEYSGPMIGHFTVMMADRNIRVGCAASIYTPAGFRKGQYLLACNYATTNMQKFPIYATCTQAASACTTATNPDYPNLCSTSEAYSVNKWSKKKL